MPNQFLLTPYLLDQPAPSLARLAGPGWQSNQPTLFGASRDDRMAVLHRQLAAFVCDTVRGGARPVSIAGDCCSAIGVLAGLQHAGLQPVVIWLDAHGDFNTRETTITGFIGGMPLAMITGRGERSLLRGAGCLPVADGDVVLTDARDLDPAERELLRASGVRHVPDVSAVLPAIPTDRPLYIHFDTDVLNPLDAPSMLYPTKDGPRLADLQALADGLARTGQVAAVSMTVWNLEGDGDRKTERACLEVLESLIGGEAPVSATIRSR